MRRALAIAAVVILPLVNTPVAHAAAPDDRQRAFSAAAEEFQVPESVLFYLALWDSILAAIPGVIAAIFYGFYGITRRTHAATRAALEAKRTQPVPPAAADPSVAPGVAPAPAE